MTGYDVDREVSMLEDDEYIEEDTDEINLDVYDTTNVGNNGLQKTEQARVVHLVHGWTQQAHHDQVG